MSASSSGTQLIVLLFRQLPVSALGCYSGSTATPQIDQLASRSDVFTAYYANPSGNLLSELRDKYSCTHLLLENSADLPSAATTDISNRIIEIPEQITLAKADQLVGEFLRLMDNSYNHPLAIVLTASRGGNQPIECLTHYSSPISESHIHLPLLVSINGQSTCRRRDALLTTDNVLQLFDSLVKSIPAYEQRRDATFPRQIQYEDQSWIATRTHEWLLIQNRSLGSEPEAFALYHQPEDIWELLDVSAQYPQVIEHFLSTGDLGIPASVE